MLLSCCFCCSCCHAVSAAVDAVTNVVIGTAVVVFAADRAAVVVVVFVPDATNFVYVPVVIFD